MTREEAIEVIRKEYACVDADCDIERSCGKCELHMPSKEPILRAYEMAIKALSQEPQCTEHPCLGTLCRYYKEPCDDAISREAVFEIINDIRDCISVEGYWAITERLKKLRPYCGADMRGESK